MHLIIDTETTGQAYNELPDSHPHQPYLVQVGLILYDAERRIRGEFNAIVKPDGWTIPDEAAEIHGITQAIAEKFGIPLKTVLSAVKHYALTAEVLSSFNWGFDGLVLRANFGRIGQQLIPEDSVKTTYCTMKPCTWICRIAKPEWQLHKYGRHDPYKWPKLFEAYRALFNEDFEGAHDAMADVRAAARIYFDLLDRSIPESFRGEIPPRGVQPPNK